VKDLNGRTGHVIAHFDDLVEVSFDAKSEIVKADGLTIIRRDAFFNLESLQGISEPTASDLKLIEKYQPLGYTPSVTDGVIATFIAADNMVDRSLARWSPKSLEALAKLPCGLPLILDHETDDVEETQGLIFDSGLIRIDNPDAYFTDTFTNKTYNRQIAQKEGYIGYVLKVFLAPDNPLINAFKYGVGSVSLGYMFSDLYCPLCGVSFWDDKCPHLIPLEESDRADNRYAPYREKMNPVEVYELSLVVEPNLPRASLVRNLHRKS